jgi:hypothetical protein
MDEWCSALSCLLSSTRFKNQFDQTFYINDVLRHVSSKLRSPKTMLTAKLTPKNAKNFDWNKKNNE